MPKFTYERLQTLSQDNASNDCVTSSLLIAVELCVADNYQCLIVITTDDGMSVGGGAVYLFANWLLQVCIVEAHWPKTIVESRAEDSQ